MAPSSKDESVLEILYESVAAIFEQAQLSVANHKKNCVALYKLHTNTVGIKGPGKYGRDTKLIGERAFQDVFIDMLSRVLVVKKGPVTADRTVKYVGSFVMYMNEKVIEAKSKKASSSSISAGNGQAEGADEDDDTPTSRFIARLLKWLSPGFVAKNKIVRLRSLQIVSEMISHLGEIEEEAYNDLRDSLIERLNDKETPIRMHATIALAKLIASEDEDGEDLGEETIIQTLLNAMSADPAAEVRRAILLNIPLSKSTLDTILTRTRDVDPVTRKLVYSGVLQTKLGNPRLLSIAQRELIVKDGLGDREPAVRVAAAKLVTSWFDMVLAETVTKKEDDNWDGDDGGVMKGLVRFLGLFDVVGPGEAVAVDAVLSIFTTKPDMPDVFVFPEHTEPFWKQLTPESATLTRIFVEHCHSIKNENRLESARLPVVTAFAFIVQEVYNKMLELLEDIETTKLLRAGLEEEENEEQEEELAKREVVMSELLRMALKLDYGDEIGRRRVFALVKEEMLAHPQLPPSLIERCLDVLKEIMPSERDLIRVIVEIVVELREGEDDDENADEPPIDDTQSDVSQVTIKKALRKKDLQDLTPEERAKADLTDIRCLMLCIAMLERVNGTFEDNSTLEGILGDLIIPSVKRKELAMREKALVSLGLCCLIAKNMALSSFQLFLSQAQNAPPELKVQVLRIIMDLLIMYDQDFFGRSEETAKQIVDFMLQILETEETPEAQAVIVTGLCKLLLAGIVTDPRVLTALALAYISPATSDNQELRQCLSYFFPVYSYSAASNQNRMSSIFMPAFDLAVSMHEDLEDDQDMITPLEFGLQMADWTNPQKAAEIAIDDKHDKNTPHVNVAVEILIALYDSNRSVEEQKALCQLLGQLHIVEGLDKRSIHKLNILLSNHDEQTPFESVAVERIFDRFKNKFTALFDAELKEIDRRQYVDEEFRDIYQRIGVDVPEEGDEDESYLLPLNKRNARKSRKSKKVDEDEDEDEAEDQEDEQEEAEEAEVEVEDAAEAAEETEPTDEQENHVDSETGNEEPEEAQEKLSPANSPTPPPKRTRKPPARKAAAKPKAATRSRKVAAPVEDMESLKSDEENIPPPIVLTATPKKNRKRAHVPGDVASPANRKKTRVKAPVKSTKDVTTDEENDSPSPSPARPPVRQTRRSKGKIIPIKAPIPEAEEASDDEDEADEVADTLAISTPTKAAAGGSSSDFGGYSD